MLKKIKKYYTNKPIQTFFILLVLVWSAYEITLTALASNTALTKEFMHSRYVMVWPIVDKKVKLYHYAEEWTTPALNGLMHLDYNNIKVTAYPTKSGNQVFATYYPNLNKNNYDISFPLDGSLSKAHFSTVDAKYYLIAKNETIAKEKLGKTIDRLTWEIEQSRGELLGALAKMKLYRLIYLVLRLIVVLLFLKWSGERSKFTDDERLPNR